MSIRNMRLAEKYKKQVVPALMKQFKCKNVMSAPKITKVSVASGFGKTVIGKSASERSAIESHIIGSLALIAGQRPSLRKAKKSIAAFKLREGMYIGGAATLRGKRMYEFLEKLLFIALPRKRDFRGIALKSISNGNLTLGFKEYSPFPEVKIEKEKGLFGLEVVVVSTAKTKTEAEALFRAMGFPLEK